MLKIDIQKVSQSGLKANYYRYDRYIFKRVKEFLWVDRELAEQTCRTMGRGGGVSTGLYALLFDEPNHKILIIQQLLLPEEIQAADNTNDVGIIIPEAASKPPVVGQANPMPSEPEPPKPKKSKFNYRGQSY